MPAAKQSQSTTDNTSVAQGRFTVQLPAELGKTLDRIGATMSDAVFQVAGVRVEMSRPQVIASLVATAEAVQAEQASEAAETAADGS